MITQTSSLRSTSLRDTLSIVFRRRRLVIACAIATVAAAIFAGIFFPRYHGEAKVLVDRERVDPLLSPTPETNTFAMAAQPIVTDEDIRSEVEMMKSTDVLTTVVKDLGLANSSPTTWWGRLTQFLSPQKPYDERVAAKANQLSRDLVIEPAKGSYIIDVVYKSKDRDLAKRVLDKLMQVYMAKHTEVHHPAGQYLFFAQQANDYKKRMDAAQAKLAAFPTTPNGSVAPEMDRGLTMQKLEEFRFSLDQTRAEIADTSKRIQRLQQAEKATPARITTQVRKADNPQLLEQLKSTLLTLELKRSELLSKYQPDYRPVQELTEQITQTRAAIQHELSSPMGDVTTDLDPTHEMIRSDLAKAQTELAGFRAREAETQAIVDNYSARARELDSSTLMAASLQRDFKTEEDNYLLYLKKSEEARITDALDAHRMVNVTLAEPPFVPALPGHSPAFFAGLAMIAMLTASVGLIWALERSDRTFHTPRELEAYLGLPVLVAIPRQFESVTPLRPLFAGGPQDGAWMADTTPTQEPLNSLDGSDKGAL
jgi:uncharacterized protein involved in exopolysaccharide biosynthesis